MEPVSEQETEPDWCHRTKQNFHSNVSDTIEEVVSKYPLPSVLAYKRESTVPTRDIQLLETRLARLKLKKALHAQKETSQSMARIVPTMSGYDMAVYNDLFQSTVSSGGTTVMQFMLSNMLTKEGLREKTPDEEVEKPKILTWTMQDSGTAFPRVKVLGLQTRSVKDQPVCIFCYGDKVQDVWHRDRPRTAPARLTEQNRRGDETIRDMDRGSSQLKQRLLMTTAADGSCFVYYPSGRLAICRSDSGTGSGHYYTYVYDDGPDATLLAMFTPLQHGCCNYKQGGIRLICNALGGHINDYNGSATRVWNWPAAGKLRSRVYLQLNEFMSVSCESSAHMTVLFSCQNEKLSFSVGWEEEVTKSGCRMQDDERHKLHFGSELSSKTRSHIPLSTVVLAAQLESHKDMRSRSSRTSSRTSSTKPLGKAVKQLPEQPGFTPLCHFGPDLSEELSNLREQVSIIVKCWAQFYRGVVGIASSAKPDCSNANLRAGTLSRSYCARPRSPSHLARSAKRKEIVHKRPKTAPAGCLPSAHRSAYGGGGSWSVHGMMGQRQPLLGTCPVVLRTKLLGNNTDGMKCKCSRIHIPFLMDIEYTEFIRNGMPVEQLLIVQVIDSRCQANTNVDRMLTEKYHAANKLRFQPCMESTDQLYRLARYDMAVAMQSTEHTEALLHRVHNVRPGTFLMYLAGRLVFCDYMFNGYGVTCRDFDKQLRSTLAAASAGHQLPANFKFSMNSSQPCSTSWDRQPRWKDDRTGYNNRRRPKSIVL